MGIVEEGQIARPGLIEGSDAPDGDLAIAPRDFTAGYARHLG